jgi:hypothetical protein
MMNDAIEFLNIIHSDGPAITRDLTVVSSFPTALSIEGRIIENELGPAIGDPIAHGRRFVRS